MTCNLDVNSYVFRNIEEAVGNIDKIDINSGIGTVKQEFNSSNLEVIAYLNDAYKEKVISYFPSTDNDLPGTVQVTLSERLYRHYLKKYGPKETVQEEIELDSVEFDEYVSNNSEMNKDNQLSLFDEEIVVPLDIDNVILNKDGTVSINGELFSFKEVHAASLEAMRFTPTQIGEILNKIC